MLAAGGILAALSAPAQTVYRHVDEHGVVHYSDSRPEGVDDVRTIRAAAEPQQIATLQVGEAGGARIASAANRLSGPVEVELSFDGAENASSTPSLPLRAVLAANGSRQLAELQQADPRLAARFGLRLRAIPGDPRARHGDPQYRLPLAGNGWRIDQGFGGRFSHHEPQSLHAVDFAVDEGTPVLAARDGVVMQVEKHFDRAGLDRNRFATRANHVRILHEDGSMAVYAHLQPDSVVVRPGARVRVGQQIGASGNTGYSSGPHLHFVVQINRGMRLESVPFRMAGPDGPIEIPGADGGTEPAAGLQ